MNADSPDRGLGQVRTPGHVSGRWRNELGSLVEIVEEPDGELRGTYRSAVGDTRDPQPLRGCCVTAADGSSVVGFAVRWAGTGSLATWTGRCAPGGERLDTTWLLESEAPPATAWRATLVGHDEFLRDGHGADQRLDGTAP